MARPRAGIKSLTFLTDTSDTGSRFLLLPLHSSSHGWLQGRAPWTQNVPGFRRKEFSLLHGLFWARYLMKYIKTKRSLAVNVIENCNWLWPWPSWIPVGEVKPKLWCDPGIGGRPRSTKGFKVLKVSMCQRGKKEASRGDEVFPELITGVRRKHTHVAPAPVNSNNLFIFKCFANYNFSHSYKC